MHWQEIAAFTVVALTAALFVRGFMKRSPSACGRGCACSSARPKSPAGGWPMSEHGKKLNHTTRT